MVGEYGLYYDKDKMTRDQEQDEEDEHPDIRHTAPQHRQYLGDKTVHWYRGPNQLNLHL